ncbi:hypothetical protein UB51_11590 [Paenibacillus sp. IHBB 10380]|nr:hypothetical protein UB51_11590 [Paenibacillus sp. IHBB 10380]
MEIRNKKMLETIENKYVNKYHDQSELIDVFWPKFVEVEECILIQKNSEKNTEIKFDHIIKQFGDRTGFEASESHVHMIDISKTFRKFPLEGLRFAKKLMEMWATKLKLDFPHYRFNVILTFHDDDTIVRFHRLRDEETLWLNIDKIEDYQEGVIVMTV